MKKGTLEKFEKEIISYIENTPIEEILKDYEEWAAKNTPIEDLVVFDRSSSIDFCH